LSAFNLVIARRASVLLAGVIYRAELVPGNRRLLLGDGGDVFREHDGETNIEMPIDVAVKEPWARVVGDEPEGGQVGGCWAGGYHVPNNGVDEVVRRVTSAPDDVEVVTVQVERVRSTGRAAGDANLDDFVRGQLINGTLGKEILRRVRARQDLEQDWRSRGDEAHIVNREPKVRQIQRDLEVEHDVGAARVRCAGNGRVDQRVEIRLDKGQGARRVRRRICVVRAGIPKNRAVRAVDEALVAPRELRRSPDPIVVDLLVGREDEGVALGGEYLNRVNRERLVCDAVYLDNGELMAVDTEYPIGITGCGNESHPIALPISHADDGEGGEWSAGISSESIDQRRIKDWDKRVRGRGVVIPICEGDNG